VLLQEAVNWQPGQLVMIATSVWRDELTNQNEVLAWVVAADHQWQRAVGGGSGHQRQRVVGVTSVLPSMICKRGMPLCAAA